MKTLTSIISLLLVSSCSQEPVYETKFTYTAAPTSQKACLESCDSLSKELELSCTTCTKKEYKKRLTEYYETALSCANTTCFDIAKSLKPEPTEHYENCTHACDDDKAKFNTCYKSCGGTVLESKVCVSNCETEK
jgi:hypothetical protein